LSARRIAEPSDLHPSTIEIIDHPGISSRGVVVAIDLQEWIFRDHHASAPAYAFLNGELLTGCVLFSREHEQITVEIASK
jgi:hypothetical protein